MDEVRRRTGRPRRAESNARREDFLRLVAEGVPADEAAKRAGVKIERGCRVLGELVRPLLQAAA